MKTYQIMTYNLDWTYKATINPNDILNEISFTSNLDWWFGQLSIKTTYELTNTDYHWWEFVKVVLFDENHKTGIQIYYWYISQIIKEIEASRQYTTLVCLWINWLLNNILYTNWEYTKTPSEMITDVITFFATNYNCITAWDIDSTDTTAQNYNREYQNCYDIIKAVCDWTWKHFIVDWDGQLNYFATWTNHLLHLHKDIERMQIADTIEDVVNDYFLARNGWTVAEYQDATSQSTFWKKMLYESNSDLNSSNTQNQYWNQYIADNKNLKETMQITLNTNFPFEDIKPWDTITVLNAEIEIDNKVVNKISYKPDQCVLTIAKTDTLRNVLDN